jgi:PadR family transcriptional regulator, regulatory protein PadR
MAKGDTGAIAVDRRKSKRHARARRGSPAAEAGQRSLYAGLIRLHVLHHAAKEPIYGFAMIEELRRHGYALSAGTLYPILHGLERKGLLSSATERAGSTERRVYRATAAGRSALAAAKAKVRELFGELFEDDGGRP